MHTQDLLPCTAPGRERSYVLPCITSASWPSCKPLTLEHRRKCFVQWHDERKILHSEVNISTFNHGKLMFRHLTMTRKLPFFMYCGRSGFYFSSNWYIHEHKNKYMAWIRSKNKCLNRQNELSCITRGFDSLLFSKALVSNKLINTTHTYTYTSHKT